MTPFMLQVAELAGVPPEEASAPLAYRTRPSVGTAVNIGADRHVAVRALAEQLLCEANAVLDRAADHLDLADEAAPGVLAFGVFYRGRTVRITTRFEDGVAHGELTGDGIEPGPPRELADAEAVANLLLALIAAAGTGTAATTLTRP